MKLKEINRTAIQSWSPSQQHPIYLATGTSAQQLDASFSTNACLEIFELDLADTSLDMKSCGTFSSSHRFHKLVWSPHGMDGAGHPNGVLIAGGENGDVILYDPAKIMAGDDDVIITQSDKHTGPVRALDVNPFQANLVASAGNESEIYIWDLNNFGSPMTPGPKTQPLEDISCVAWNRQVQHILASASPSGRASVWDLRKNDLIIKVSDHSNRMHCSGLAWNPEVATQLVLSSEDDRMPVIQMWDLRFATSPLKILENHTRGVLAMDWSLADPELLLSCGKDNRILCWNPNTAEVLYELPTSTQWCFDIKWCPRNPAVLSAAAFDGNIGIYSIMGGSSQAQNQRQADQITNSFGNMDPFGTGQALPPLQMPQAPCPAPPAMVNPLKKPPKWIRRPVGASFAFGGKLVTLDNAPSNPQQPAKHVVHVSQVVTETAFLERSDLLQATLSNGNFVDFCQEKIAAAQDGFERTVWSFLKVNFDSDVRGQYLDLLGYKKEELALKVLKKHLKFKMFDFNLEEEEEEEILLQEVGCTNWCLYLDVDGLITQALLTGDFEGAVDLCILDNRMADSIILAIAGGSELLEKTQKKYFSKTHTKLTKLISAVVMKDWTDILTSCDLANWKEPLAAVMTYARPDEFSAFCDLLGGRLEVSQDAVLQAQASLCYICAGNVEKVVSCWTRAQPTGGDPPAVPPPPLQDLVEKVVVLRRAVEQARRGGAAPTASSVLLEEMMGQYAGLLASQGSLATALAYLSGSTNQVGPARRPEVQPRGLAQGCWHESPCCRRGPVGWCGPAMAFTLFFPRGCGHHVWSGVSLCVQVRAASTVTSWSNQTPTALPSIPPVQLASGPDQQVHCHPPPLTVLPPRMCYSWTGPNYQPFQYPAASLAAPPSPTSLPPAPGFRSQYMQPGPGPSPVYQPLSCSPPYNAPYFPTAPTSSSASSSPTYAPGPLAHGTPFQHGGPGSPVSYMQSPFGGPGTHRLTEINNLWRSVVVGPQNGWNDPPALNRAGTKKKGLENYTPPAPITAPIMGPPGSDPQAQPMSPVSLQGSMDPGQGAFQGPFSGRQQLPPSSGGHPAMPQTSVEGPPGAPTGDHIQPMQSIPAEKILKKPIPEEHVVLKTTFEGVIQKCLAVASDPQTKRKLDDASKRLEALYDKLREQSLSPAIVGGLHNIARSIESRAYTDGLNIHTHIVSSSNFSETSAFMPVLKVVLTQANKLGV
uniref:Protein transport protein Sec31A n=1 Tax=Gadus morhua TaxID=8049 RepID=A0A8C5BXM2_GADMO